MASTFNLQQLVATQFGLDVAGVASSYVPLAADRAADSLGLGNRPFLPLSEARTLLRGGGTGLQPPYQAEGAEEVADEPSGYLATGQLYWDYVQLGPGSYQELDYASGQPRTRTFEEVLIPGAFTAVRRPKRIIRQPLQAGPGDIIQAYGRSNREIAIYGVVLGEGRSYPWQEVQRLDAILDALTFIPIRCPKVNQFGISEMVVLDYDFPPYERHHNVQLFNIVAVEHIGEDLPDARPDAP